MPQTRRLKSPSAGGTWAPGQELLQEGGLWQSQAGATLDSVAGGHWSQGPAGSAKCLPSPHLLGLVPGGCAVTLPSLATGRSWGFPGGAVCGAGAPVNQKLWCWGRGSPFCSHSRAAAPVRGHYAFPSTPPAAGLPALHAGDEGFHNPAQTGLKRNTQVNKSRPRNAGRAVQGVDPPGRWVRRGLRGRRGAGAMPAGAGTARDSAGSRRESRFRAALSNLIFHTSPVVKLPLSEERSCFLLFPLKSLSRSLAGRLWQDGTARAHELQPSLPRAPAALGAPGDWPLSHGQCDNELRAGRWDPRDNPALGGELHRHHTDVLGLLRRPDEERDDVRAVRMESHQQALQRAAGLPGVLGRPPELQLPQRTGGAVHLPEPSPLLPQLHPGAPGVRRPTRRCAPGHDHRTHLPHPLPCHPGHLAQQGRQGTGLELPSRPALGHGPPAAGPPDHPNRPVGSRGHQPVLLRRSVPPAPSPAPRPGIKRFSPHAWRWFFGRSIPPEPRPGPAPTASAPPARSRRQLVAVGNAPGGTPGPTPSTRTGAAAARDERRAEGRG